MTRSPVLTHLAALAICAVMAGCALAFAQAQTIWVDESTQLSGLSLGYLEQWTWLAAWSDHPFAVPADRMPPLSYWLGRTWSMAFGLSETSMRVFGIVAILCAAPALFLAGRRVGGPTAGLFAMAVLLLSPSLVMQGVEIRAYPVLFALSAWATYVFVLLITSEDRSHDRRRLIWLTALLVASCYTHFYGLVLSGMIFVVLLAERILSHKPVGPVLICGLVGGIVALGTVPFIAAAVALSGSGGADSLSLAQIVADAARLAFRILASPVLLASPVALVAALGGLAILANILIWASLTGSAEGEVRNRFLVLSGPIVLAFLTLSLAATQVSTFALFAPHYNLWMMPLVGVIFALAFAVPGRWSRVLVRVSALCIIGAQVIGLWTLISHRSLYSHGPSEAIASRIGDPSRTLVIHDATGLWAHSYFPLSYLTDGDLTQWLQEPGSPPRRVVKGGLETVEQPEDARRSFDTVIHVYTVSLDSAQLAEIVKNDEACQIPPGPLPVASEAPVQIYCAYVAARYTVEERRTAQQATGAPITPVQGPRSVAPARVSEL